MSKTAYIELPLKPEHAEDFANLANSDEGFALTQKQPGFISAEWMISTAEDGSTCFHLWETWESPELSVHICKSQNGLRAASLRLR